MGNSPPGRRNHVRNQALVYPRSTSNKRQSVHFGSRGDQCFAKFHRATQNFTPTHDVRIHFDNSASDWQDSAPKPRNEVFPYPPSKLLGFRVAGQSEMVLKISDRENRDKDIFLSNLMQPRHERWIGVLFHRVEENVGIQQELHTFESSRSPKIGLGESLGEIPREYLSAARLVPNPRAK